jgi:hypothetical protein
VDKKKVIHKNSKGGINKMLIREVIHTPTPLPVDKKK